MSEPRPIDSISTEELMAELTSRCSPSVFIGTKNEGPEGKFNFYNINGDLNVCYGMCYELTLVIQRKALAQEKSE